MAGRADVPEWEERRVSRVAYDHPERRHVYAVDIGPTVWTHRESAGDRFGGHMRSMRAKADTKTRKSRRILGLTRLAVAALRSLHEESQPQPEDLVFCTDAG